MKIRTLLLFIFVTALQISAQQIYVCENYSQDGQPVDVMEEVTITPGGQYHYILFRNNETIKGSMVYLFIDKLTNGNFEPYASNPVDVKNESDWLVEEYYFKEEGRYKINIVSSSNKLLASKRVNVVVKQEFLQPADSYTGNNDYSTNKITFARAIFQGKPANVRESIKLNRSDNLIFIYVDYKRPFNGGKISVEIERDADGDKDFEEKVASKKYRIQPDWEDTFFRYDFTLPGVYKFTVYDHLDLLVDYAYFTVYQ